MRVLPTFLLIILSGLIVTPSAAARETWVTLTPQQQEVITEWAYKSAGQPTAPYPGHAAAAQGVTTEMAEAMATVSTPAETAATESIAKGQYDALRRARLLRSLESSAKIAGRFLGLTTTAAAVGWSIGSGINRVFLKIGVPTAPPEPDYASHPTLHALEAGDALFWLCPPGGCTSTPTPTAPYDSWYLRWYQGQRMHWLGYADEGGGSCSQPATPTSFTVVKGPTFANLCMGGTWPNQHYVSGHYRSFIRGALHPVAPARPIAAGDTPWLETVAAPDPGATTAMEGLAAALDDDANELLGDELGHLTTPGHVDEEDPYRLATSAHGQNRCEPSAREPDPGRYFPGYVGGGPPEQQVRDTFPGVLRPGHSATTVSLHWGNRAFGERHI